MMPKTGHGWNDGYPCGKRDSAVQWSWRHSKHTTPSEGSGDSGCNAAVGQFMSGLFKHLVL